MKTRGYCGYFSYHIRCSHTFHEVIFYPNQLVLMRVLPIISKRNTRQGLQSPGVVFFDIIHIPTEFAHMNKSQLIFIRFSISLSLISHAEA